MSDELEALRSQVESDPGHPAFPIWVEWLRRQGRLAEAERAARAGLEDAPGRAEGRAALALVLLDRGEEDAARATLVEAVSAIAGAEVLSPPEATASDSDGADGTDAPAAGFDADEIEQAFDRAEARPDEMVSADDIAQRALREALGGSVDLDSGAEEEFGAGLAGLETAGSGMDDRGAFELDAAEVLAPPEPLVTTPDAASDVSDASDRARIIATLELWLQNLRRSAQ